MTFVPASFGDETPSGENLEYEQVFTDMTLAAQSSDERQMGDEVVPGEEADPKAIVSTAMAVLERSHDLRAAVLLGYGKLKTEGLSGFAEATGYIRACLEEFWDTCHPQLDAEDDNDPTMRVNAVRDIASPQETLRALRYTPLTESRNFGRISVRDLMIASGEQAAPEGDDPPPGDSQIAAAFSDTDPETLAATLAAARAAQENVIAINAVFDEKTPGQGPDLSPVLAVLKKAVSRLAEATGGDAEAGADDAAEAAPDGGSAAAPAAARPGEINSARDVEQALERIIRYYERSEPSSPVPLIIKRAQRLIGADFMTIVRDMAPDGADNVRKVSGITESDEGY